MEMKGRKLRVPSTESNSELNHENLYNSLLLAMCQKQKFALYFSWDGGEELKEKSKEMY